MTDPPSTRGHLVTMALFTARVALRSAELRKQRTDCLREAVRNLEGALRNVSAQEEHNGIR